MSLFGCISIGARYRPARLARGSPRDPRLQPVRLRVEKIPRCIALWLILSRFLLRQCQDLLSGVDEETLVVRNRRPSERSSLEYQSFAIRDDVRIYMYSSEAPCGDASMHLTVAASDDPTPWHVPESKSTRSNSPTKILHGRDHFSILGVVRTKPCKTRAPR